MDSEPEVSPKPWQNWMELGEVEEVQEISTKIISPKTISSNIPESQGMKVQAQYLGPDTIYWDEVEELFIHVSGMYFNPGAKAYCTLID